MESANMMPESVPTPAGLAVRLHALKRRLLAGWRRASMPALVSLERGDDERDETSVARAAETRERTGKAGGLVMTLEEEDGRQEAPEKPAGRRRS
jgi:hypothetical protein